MCSTTALASPYIGIQYGMGNVSTDETVVFDDKVTLTPDGSTDTLGVFIGYRFNDKFALEIGYSNYQVDQSRDKFNGIVKHQFPGSVTPLDAVHETEWDAEMEANQWSIMPTYSHALNDKWEVIVGVGLTYSQYSFSGHSADEFEAVINDDIEQTVLRSVADNVNKSAVGGIGKIGVNYFILPPWQVGLSAQYQVDSITSVAQLALTTSYHF